MEAIHSIAEILFQKGVHQVVVSPGSRCAPLTISMARHKGLQLRTITDERSAGFIALGLSQGSQKATALVCTSGTAALNYYPAITEAFYSKTPLLVLTADRPTEWIDQADGQTIRQQNVFQNHVKKSYQLPSDYTHQDAKWMIERVLSEAINLTLAEPQGPVHINIPLREPLYPSQEIVFKEVRVIDEVKSVSILAMKTVQTIVEKLAETPKTIILVGQGEYNPTFVKWLGMFADKLRIPIIADCLANVHELPKAILTHDFFLNTKIDNKDLQPDLVISMGGVFISKNLKTFIRTHSPSEHWHIQEAGEVADIFQCLTTIFRVSAATFLQQISPANKERLTNDFFDLWIEKDKKIKEVDFETHYSDFEFSEMQAYQTIIKQLPENSVLHLANSMAVRYGNYFGFCIDKSIQIYANRGTSGIDGSTSTSIGIALAQPEKTHVLLTGDLAFFYDRNAFWNSYLPNNWKVIVFNNHAGGIFRMIDGPNAQPELETYFETSQPLNAKSLASEFGISYHYCNSIHNVHQEVNTFITSDKAAIMEIETNSVLNTAVLKGFMKKLV